MVELNDAKARRNLYSFLSRVYLREVDRPFLDLLKGADTVETLKGYGFRFYDDLLTKSEETILEDLAVEFASLFLVSPGRYLSPYESVQTGRENQLGGEAATKTMLFYKSAGFSIPEGCNLFPDHFAIELEFMGHLCGKEADALMDENKTAAAAAKQHQREFFTSHLGRWYKPFLNNVEKVAHPFYREMSSLAKGFIYSEGGAISETVLASR